MLCARPNENIGLVIQRPFISRVDPKEPIGLNPVKIIRGGVTQKSFGSSAILKRHRMWLESFKEKVRQKKEQDLMADINRQQSLYNVREKATEQREKIRGYKQEYDQTTSRVEDGPVIEKSVIQPKNNSKNEMHDTNSDPAALKHHPTHRSNPEIIPSVRVAQPRLTENNLKELEKQAEIQTLEKQTQELQQKLFNQEAPRSILKGSNKKPKWAYSEKQLEENEDKEVEELLRFTDRLDYEKYINDLEVKNTIALLKKRIEELKKEDDWKKKIVEKWNEENKSEAKNVQHQENLDDNRTQASEAQSAASEKSQKSIKSLKDQLQQREQNKQDWDKSSTIENKAVSLEDRIAKHVADEILRNNAALGKVHSNASLRKILEKEASKYMEETASTQRQKLTNTRE